MELHGEVSSIDFAISPILPHLLLGNLVAASSESILRRHGIKRVLTVMFNPSAIPIERRVPGVSYKHIVKNDLPGEDMLCSFEEAFQYLKESIDSRESLLVHCHMGISRSATLVLAYLMRTNRWTFDCALAFLQARRAIVNPNWGFRYQLKLYQRMNYRLDGNCKEFRLYFLNCFAFRNYTEDFQANLRDYLQRLEEIERTSQLTISELYRCICCSKSLFTNLNLLDAHDQGSSTDGGIPPFHGVLVPVRGLCKNYLLEPVPWMLASSTGQYLFGDFPRVSSGPIGCPFCEHKLGHFTFYPFQTSMCNCAEHCSIMSFLSLELRRDCLTKKSLKQGGIFAKFFSRSSS